MTDQYLELYRKAHQFADLFEYDLVVYNGNFNFYNSPFFKSFKFSVIPETFKDCVPERYLYERFEERKNS